MIRLRSFSAALAAVALLVGVCAASNAESLRARFNAGAGNSVKMQVIGTISEVGGEVQGSLHIQTLSGIFEGNTSTFSAIEQDDGVWEATAVTLGYYQPNGGRLTPCVVTTSFTTSPGHLGEVTVTIQNYYTHALIYSSGPMAVMSGYMIMGP
jgi:hypothetical protein